MDEGWKVRDKARLIEIEKGIELMIICLGSFEGDDYI